MAQGNFEKSAVMILLAVALLACRRGAGAARVPDAVKSGGGWMAAQSRSGDDGETRVRRVPGFPHDLGSEHHAGYITVDEKHGR